MLHHESIDVHNYLIGQHQYHKKVFKFEHRDRIKILQISDIQLESDSAQCRDYDGLCETTQTITFMQKLFREDKPDLVVFGGDNVYGKYNDKQARKVLEKILQPVESEQIDFVAILGNHDVERYGMSVTAMHELFRSKNALFSGNGVLTIQHNDIPICNIFFFDYIHNMGILWFFYQFLPTNVLIQLRLPVGTSTNGNVNGITREQVNWFRYETENRNWNSSIVFNHVPLPEYNSLNFDKVIGDNYESVSSFAVNEHSNSFWNALTSAQIGVVSVAHDHINDFCGNLSSGPHLCYSGGSGYTTYGRKGWPRRVRYFVIDKNGRIQTYKRLDDEDLSMIHSQNLN